MRVRIHLNLAAPHAAESVIKAQSSSGRWVTVAYGDGIQMEDVRPVVNLQIQERVRAGRIGKVPHAFLEGNLVSFRGRLRELAPASLKTAAARHLSPRQGERRPPVHAAAVNLHPQTPPPGQPIGYNPRFARCFYAKAAAREQIDREFVHARRVTVTGWTFAAHGGRFRPLSPQDRCAPADMEKTSAFERQALRQGEAVTHALAGQPHTPSPHSTRLRR